MNIKHYNELYWYHVGKVYEYEGHTEIMLLLPNDVVWIGNEPMLAETLGIEEDKVLSFLRDLVKKGALARTTGLYHFACNKDYPWGDLGFKLGFGEIEKNKSNLLSFVERIKKFFVKR